MESTILRPGLRIAVLGHARHGKSALVSALTERVASRPYASKTRPVAFVAAPGWASGLRSNGLIPTHATFRVESPMRDYAGVDAVSHRRLTRHVGVVASSVDACVLVVSAIEGAMPQTREHALLARHLSPRGVVVFINRCDEVTDLEQLDLAEMDAREALHDAGFDGDSAAVVRGAARPPPEATAGWAGALDDLLDALDQTVPDGVHDAGAPLCATVLHRWTRPSREGPVVELSVRQGALRVGARLNVLDRTGALRRVRVLMLRAFDALVESLDAGGIGTALLAFDDEKWDRGRRSPRMGDLLFDRPPPRLMRRVTARVRLLTARQGGRHTPLRTGHEASVWFAGRYARCRVVLPAEVPELAPGASRDDVTVELASAAYVSPGATFVLRDGSDGRGRPPYAGPAAWGGCFATGEVLAAFD